MGIAILVLFILSWVAVVVGIVWTIVRFGEHQRRSGREVGEEMVESMMQRDAEKDGAITVARKVAFKGKAASVGGNTEFSFAEIKQAVLQGNWSFALPILTAFGGMLGVFVFAALGMFFYINKVVGLLFMGATVYAVVQTIRGFRRA